MQPSVRGVGSFRGIAIVTRRGRPAGAAKTQQMARPNARISAVAESSKGELRCAHVLVCARGPRTKTGRTPGGDTLNDDDDAINAHADDPTFFVSALMLPYLTAAAYDVDHSHLSEPDRQPSAIFSH